MNDKKMLWVILAIAFGMLVVVGAAFLLLLPADSNPASSGEFTIDREAFSSNIDTVEALQTEQESPGLANSGVLSNAADAVAVSGDIVIGNSDTAADSVTATSVASLGGISQSEIEVLTTPRAVGSTDDANQAAVVGDTPAGNTQDRSSVSGGGSQVYDTAFSSPVATDAAAGAVTDSGTANNPPRSEDYVAITTDSNTADFNLTGKQYWIQLAAVSSSDRAFQTSQWLQDRGVATAVTTKMVNGSWFYRLRNGPYASKSEAEKFHSWFLQWLQGLTGRDQSMTSGMLGSYISETSFN